MIGEIVVAALRNCRGEQQSQSAKRTRARNIYGMHIKAARTIFRTFSGLLNVSGLKSLLAEGCKQMQAANPRKSPFHDPDCI
jgi:hypothetical protein